MLRRWPGVRGTLAVCFLFAGLIFARAADAEPAAAIPAEPPATAADPVEASVVKIFATLRRPDYMKPWTKSEAQDVSGSGVVIEGQRILTNAHVVQYASQVQIQSAQSGEKLAARVEFFAPAIDLAILTLDDPSFFDAHPPLPRAATLPALKSTVMAYGFPTGGTNLSVTKGIVSRIEYVQYGGRGGNLRVQIDAPLNPGNSGGPVVLDGRMVGVAFSGLSSAQSIGFVIPVEEVELCLKDIADGRYDGKPALFTRAQSLEGAALRNYLRVPATASGVVVYSTGAATAEFPLRPDDVLLRIGDQPIDAEGMVKVGDLRLNYRYLVQRFGADGPVPFTVWRGGKELAVRVPAELHRPQLLRDIEGGSPPYFVYGPIVFSTATRQLVASLLTPASRPENVRTQFAMIARMEADGNPLLRRSGERPAFPDEELVIVCGQPLVHRVSRGLPSTPLQVVSHANGVKVRNLAHLVEILRDTKDENTRIDFEGEGGELLVLSHRAVLAAVEEILTDNSIRAQASPEILAVWNAKKQP